MKFRHIIILYLAFSGLVFSQTLFTGLNGDIGIINKNSGAGAGAGVNFEYSFQELPFSARVSYRVYTASFEDVTYLPSYSYVFSAIDGDIIYSPFSGSLDPYIGLGLSYNIPSISNDGNADFIGGKQLESGNPENSLNYNLLFGLRFTPERFFSPYIELLYWPVELNYDVTLTDYYNTTTTVVKSKTNLDKFVVRLGFCLRIYN